MEGVQAELRHTADHVQGAPHVRAPSAWAVILSQPATVGPVPRVFASLFSIGLAAAMLSPAFEDPPQDSFPLSDYPMFSQERASPELTLEQALAVMPDGERRPLPPSISADSVEVLQSMVTIHREIHAGSERAAAFCAAVAGRALRDPEFASATAVEIASSRFDTVAYFEGHSRPLDRVVLVRCLARHNDGEGGP